MLLHKIFYICLVIAFLAFCSLAMACYFLQLRYALRELRLARNFKKFEESLLDPNFAQTESPFLTGETKLPTEIAIHLPNCPDGDALVSLIEQGLEVHSLGIFIRKYYNGDNLSFDIKLNDFVSGVEFLRNLLLEHQVPKGSIIEYGGGDLSIHD